MTRATAEAQAAHRPDERVYTVTRAGPPGIQRYAQTWSGRQHDELAHAALEPAHGADDEPVRHVQHRPRCRRLQRAGAGRRIARALGAERRVQPALHHELVEVGRRSEHAMAASRGDGADSRGDPLSLPPDAVSVHAVPARRTSAANRSCGPLCYEFEDDPRAFADCDDFMLGPQLLVANVVEPGAARAPRLPADMRSRAGTTFTRESTTRAGATSSCRRRSTAFRCSRAPGRSSR